MENKTVVNMIKEINENSGDLECHRLLLLMAASQIAGEDKLREDWNFEEQGQPCLSRLMGVLDAMVTLEHNDVVDKLQGSQKLEEMSVHLMIKALLRNEGPEDVVKIRAVGQLMLRSFMAGVGLYLDHRYQVVEGEELDAEGKKAKTLFLQDPNHIESQLASTASEPLE